MRRLTWLAISGIFALAPAGRAAATPAVDGVAPASPRGMFRDPPEEVPLGQLRARSFGSADGLRNFVVWSMAQDAEGMIWVGTDDGAYRYDGKRFTHFSLQDGLLSTAVLVLGVAPDGQVCAGGAHGMACWNAAARRFDVAKAAGLPAKPTRAIVRRARQLWVATSDGLYVQDGDAPFVPAPGWPRGRAAVRALWADERGVLVAFGTTVVRGDGKGAWQSEDELTSEPIDGVVRDPGGVIWIRTALRVWAWSPAEHWLRDLTGEVPTSQEATGYVAPLTVSPTGEIWIGTDHGIAYRRDDRWHVVSREAGLPVALTRSLLIDREGSIWWGAIGLFQWTGRSLIERYDAQSGLPGDVVLSTGRDTRGELWLGTDRCLARPVAGTWECQPGTNGRIVRAAAWLPDGSGFIGGAPGDLLYIDPNGATRSLKPEPYQLDEHILTMALDPGSGPDRDLWFGTKSALYRLPHARPGPIERVAIPGVATPTRVSQLITADGRLWVTTEQGLALREDGRWRLLGVADGLRAPSMRYLLRRADGRICVSYTEAIGFSCFRYDGQRLTAIEHMSQSDGLAAGMIYSLGEDRQQRLWICTGNGIDVVTPQGLDHFGEADGLVGNDCVGTALFVDRDGSLWLGASGGASHLAAQHYTGPPPAPTSVIVRSSLGGRLLPRDANQPPRVHADASSLLVEFAADSFLDPERLDFQTRLVPAEHNWTTNPTREVRAPALPPGSYRLEIRARLGAGPWGPTAELQFHVLATWWQTRWIVALLSAAALGLLAVGFAWRNRAMVRRRTRQLIAQADASFRAHLDSIPDVVAVYRDGVLVHLNAMAHSFLGGDVDPRDRVHDEDRAALTKLIARTPPAGPEHNDVVEVRLCAADGSWRLCEVSSLRLRYGGTPVMVVSGRDVTERQRMRAQLLISDRLASVGTLAAGVAHEINNPLAYVAGNLEVVTELIARDAPLSDADRSDAMAALDDARDGAARVQKIVHELRSFNRVNEERRAALELVTVIERATKLTQNEVRHRARLTVELGAAPRVIADDGRLTQVLINLLINAAQAVPPGHAELHRVIVRTYTDERGHAVIEVEDTGPGMPPHVRARAFDPFFTTKDVGQGTGLGLSICHSIISALGGQISIETGALGGCLMRVTLPPDRSEPPGCAPREPAAVGIAARRRRVLVIDDDPLVTTALERMLRKHHDVTVAGSGELALRRITDGARFDAIISDVMMPTMTGLDVLDRVALYSPEQAQRFVFLSGGVFSEELRKRLDATGAPQLAKPVDGATLRAEILRVADAPSSLHPA